MSRTRDDEKVRQVELLISGLLRVGVVTSLLVVLTGTVISFVHHREYLRSTEPLRRLTTPGGAAFPHNVHEVWRGVKEGRGQAIVVVGLLLLIATPVMRVAVSVFAFVYERDPAFVLITSIVLLLLLLSFVLGKAEG